MATSIHNVLAVNLQNFNSATAVADRTFTTTRALRVFDMKAYCRNTAGASLSTLTVAQVNGIITSVATPNPPVVNTVYRLGSEIAASVCRDDLMLIPAAGTIIFNASTAGDNFDMTAFCVTA